MRLAVLFLMGILCMPAARAADAAPSRLFQPPHRPAPPQVKNTAWPCNPIDLFILSRLEAKQLEPNRPADRLRLLRRVMFDLTGQPPTVEEQESFLRDRSPDAYEKLVDRLLASPRFGERMALPWLDLVRYAETDGFKSDDLRPDAHKYRDQVIRAFNANLPYDVFVRRQIAGDELEPGNIEALIATGFNRLWPDEYNAANLEQRRQEILDDTTDTFGFVFLGLTVACARCHDHKYDPISQKDYYRLQAFFAPMQPRDLPAVDADQLREYQKRRAAWETATAAVRTEMEKILAPKREQLRADALMKFRAEIQSAVRTPPGRRTPYQQLIALMAEKQMDGAAQAAPTKLPKEAKSRYQALARQLAALGTPPAPLPRAMAVTDVGSQAPPTYRLIGGDWHKPAAEVAPGFLSALGNDTPDMHLPPGMASTGRRAALARWLTRPGHPLTARVMVNRLWQHYFRAGIVSTANDFGVQGTPPTHPELLDWLAVEFVESGWDLKHLHRLMVTSAAYRQDSLIDPRDPKQARALAVDHGNGLLWHANRRRLQGEELRDAMLALSGELNLRMFGPSAKPVMPEGMSRYAWKPDENPRDRQRRSIYVLAKRNQRYPLFEAFDLPDMHNSCACRPTTTTAPQSLMLLNSGSVLQLSQSWAQTLLARHGEDDTRIAAEAFASAWGRNADGEELNRGVLFLGRAKRANHDRGMPHEKACTLAVEMFCHALMNTNEFAYID